MKHHSSRLGRKEGIAGLLLVTPQIIYFLVFFLLPLGICVYAGFTNWNILSPLRKFVGLRNFDKLFSDPKFWTACKNTLYYLIPIPFYLTFALAFAYSCHKRILGEKVFRVLYYLPFISSIVGTLEKKREDVCVLALLDTLEYLKLGGRISKTVALAGGLLNIKPVCTIQDGEILLVGKARGSKQGNNLLVEKIRECGGIDFSLPILLGYTGLSDASLKKYVEDSRAIWQEGAQMLDSTMICGVIGTHTGPGVVAAAFFKKPGT